VYSNESQHVAGGQRSAAFFLFECSLKNADGSEQQS